MRTEEAWQGFEMTFHVASTWPGSWLEAVSLTWDLSTRLGLLIA